MKTEDDVLLTSIYTCEVLYTCLCDDELTPDRRAMVQALVLAGDVEMTLEDGKTYYTLTDRARERLGVA